MRKETKQTILNRQEDYIELADYFLNIEDTSVKVTGICNALHRRKYNGYNVKDYSRWKKCPEILLFTVKEEGLCDGHYHSYNSHQGDDNSVRPWSLLFAAEMCNDLLK